MSVHPFSIPQVLWLQWAIVFSGISISVGGVAEIMGMLVAKNNQQRLYNLTNVWLLVSGVVHVCSLSHHKLNIVMFLFPVILFMHQLHLVLDWVQFCFLPKQVNLEACNGSVCECWQDYLILNFKSYFHYQNFNFYLDYRYGDYDGVVESGTAAMEFTTATIVGPLCFFVVFAAVKNYSLRHPLQIVLCTMQIYGLLWYILQPYYSPLGPEGHYTSDPVSKLFCTFIFQYYRYNRIIISFYSFALTNSN